MICVQQVWLPFVGVADSPSLSPEGLTVSDVPGMRFPHQDQCWVPAAHKHRVQLGVFPVAQPVFAAFPVMQPGEDGPLPVQH
jgi:hypothetical protein